MIFPGRMPSARMPCARCGESVTGSTSEEHRCDPLRRVEFQMAAMRPGIATFVDDLGAYLAGNEGRFETWLAEREVRRSA